MTKKKTPAQSAVPAAEPKKKPRKGGPAGRTPGSHRDRKEQRAKVQFSESGVNRHGNRKQKNTPDTTTERPVVPDKDPRPAHVLRGLELGLTLKQIEFVEVYLTCYNGTQTYRAVYGSTNYNVAGVESHRALNLPHVKAYMGERMKEAFARTEAAQDQLIQSYQYIAYGDVNELIQYRREACRYCHGNGHLYHFTPEELRRAREDHRAMSAEAKAKSPAAVVPEFDEQGGLGFDPRRDPHPDCPECFGEGRGRVHFNDTRNLSPAALALYEGAEITKDGIKVRTGSRESARGQLAKILKVYEETGANVNITFTADEMEKRFGESMRIAHERAAKMRAERGMAPTDPDVPAASDETGEPGEG